MRRKTRELDPKLFVPRAVAPAVLFSSALLFLLPSYSAPGPESLERFVANLEASYRNVRTMRAEFRQTYIWGGRRRVEAGTVYFARGGEMRWEYREPEAKLFVSDGKSVELYVPGEKQLTRSAVKSSDDFRIPFRLLLSRPKLRKAFGRIELAVSEAVVSPGDTVLRGLPRKGDEDVFREVLLEVTPSFDIRRLVIRYPDDTRMEFEFDGIARNLALGPSVFRFSPPPGTDIIEPEASGR